MSHFIDETAVDGFDNSYHGYVVDPIYMTTVMGQKFDPLLLKPEEVLIADIAHALAMQCRYNGHCAGHLSVARHSVWVSHEVGIAFGHDPELEFMGLMHDAAEAYTGDIIRPIKHRPQMAAFKEIEEHVERQIAVRFGFQYPIPPEIKAADATITGGRERHERGHWDTTWRQDEAAFMSFYDAIQLRRVTQ
jgi:5'-deoxynucleotidase YfbR-like HD superfamily hydrolase